MNTLAIGCLGNRICIIGCSSSGKSTLAMKLSKKLGLPVTPLDHLAHYPDSDWIRRPDAEFIVEHQKAIIQEKWIVEGNYSICMQERFARATGIIWIDPNVLGAVFRYIKRSFFPGKSRVGKLPGAKKEFSYWLLKHILINYPKNRVHYERLLTSCSVPIIKIKTMRALNKLFEA